MDQLIYGTWPWWLSGSIIAAIMFLLLFFGQSFGFSSNMRTICAAVGCGKHVKFFDFNWKSQSWNLLFLLGSVIGGYIAGNFMSNGDPVRISEDTVSALNQLGFSAPASMQPDELFGTNVLLEWKGLLLLAVAGLMVGFGTRYAGGCTSGHAISGLSNLQLPSLIAVIGFFAGGLLMTHLIFPLIF
jgi:uncharacterized membrane protein YedE/YeeE